jgi:Domain of unknown function (DUF4091)
VIPRSPPLSRRLLAPASLVLAALLAPRAAGAAPVVWAIDDGEKLKQDAVSLPFATGTDNPVWAPGQPIRLFALRDETIAFQIVVTTDDAALDGITVDLDALAGPGGAAIANAAGATDPTRFVGRRIERFVEHWVAVPRASGGIHPGEALGWNAGSGPPRKKWVGHVADALIPVEVAPSWAPYPMHVAPHRNGAVWVDLTLPKDQAPGLYKGVVRVQSAAGPLAELPVEVEVADLTLPDHPIQAFAYYEHEQIERRMGHNPAAEHQLWQLLHRHHIAPFHEGKEAHDVNSRLSALDGSAYTPERGYEGTAVGVGDGVMALGMYGSYGFPTTTALARVERVANWFAENPPLDATEVLVFAADEDCKSLAGSSWKHLLEGSTKPSVKRVRVVWTCSQSLADQAVDAVIVHAGSFKLPAVAAAREKGKEVWIYNGERPHTGSCYIDAEAIDPRVNPWIGALRGIDRWLAWESTFWYDENKGGHGSIDPFKTAENFHNKDGDYSNGDGLLLYPGKQVDLFRDHSVGMDGVIASIRLKNWRRGIEDAGYYALAHAVNAADTEAVAKELVPKSLEQAAANTRIAWSRGGKAFFDARKGLLSIIRTGKRPPGAIGNASTEPAEEDPLEEEEKAPAGCGCKPGCSHEEGALLLPLLGGLPLARRFRRRQ